MLGKPRKPIFTDHARLNMGRRAISEAEVLAVMENHHTTFPGTNPKTATTVLVGVGTDGSDLCVVVGKRKPFLVITAYRR